MAEGSENGKGRLSWQTCNDSSFDERYLSVSVSEEDSHSGSAGQEDGVSSTDVLGTMAPCRLGMLATQ